MPPKGIPRGYHFRSIVRRFIFYLLCCRLSAIPGTGKTIRLWVAGFGTVDSCPKKVVSRTRTAVELFQFAKSQFRGSKQQKCDQIFAVIKKHYDIRGTPSTLGKLKVDMFYKEEGWVKLSAKAADTQQLLFVMVDVCAELNDHSDRDMHRLIALRELAGM